MRPALRIIYAGTPEFSAVALEALLTRPCAVDVEVVAVFTQPDRPAGRGRKLQPSPVKQLALEHEIPVYQPASLRGDDTQQVLRSLDADLMVVTAYGLILPAGVLQAPRLGCINIHASLLPRWRGAAPIQRAILAGDSTTGITIMQMDEGLDTGDMLAVAECPIDHDDTGSTLHDKLMLLGAETLLDVLPSIADQSLCPQKQDDSAACYAEKLTKAEAAIDWTRSAQQIVRAVRAFNPWPVAFCRYAKDRQQPDVLSSLKVWRARAVADESNEGSSRTSIRTSPGKPPGMVLSESAQGIDVQTGKGVLRIQEVQAEGKRRMSVADFLNANSVLGEQFR